MFKKNKKISLMNVSCLSYSNGPDKIDFAEHCILSGHSIKIM